MTDNDTVKTLIVGALSGFIADSATHPICTVKARLMVQGAGSNIEKYNGLFHGFRSIISKEGIKGLYPGFSAVAVGAAPAQALYFTGYETTRKLLGNNASVNFLSGINAQLFGSLCWVPMEVVKEKLMIQGQMATKNQYSGSFNLVSTVLKNEGIRGIYRGFFLQMLTYGPFNGLAIMFYNEFKRLTPEALSGNASNLISSAGGYALASLVTNPFDVVKTRRQVQMSNPDVFNYKNGFDCFQQILKTEGVAALFDGVSARIGWLTPRCAIAMTSYEFLFKQFSKEQKEAELQH